MSNEIKSLAKDISAVMSALKRDAVATKESATAKALVKRAATLNAARKSLLALDATLGEIVAVAPQVTPTVEAATAAIGAGEPSPTASPRAVQMCGWSDLTDLERAIFTSTNPWLVKILRAGGKIDLGMVRTADALIVQDAIERASGRKDTTAEAEAAQFEAEAASITVLDKNGNSVRKPRARRRRRA